MDKGVLFKGDWRVRPCLNGSFTIFIRDWPDRMMSDAIAFSDIHDLMAFLNSEYEATKLQGPQPPEGQ